MDYQVGIQGPVAHVFTVEVYNLRIAGGGSGRRELPVNEGISNANSAQGYLGNSEVSRAAIRAFDPSDGNECHRTWTNCSASELAVAWTVTYLVLRHCAKSCPIRSKSACEHAAWLSSIDVLDKGVCESHVVLGTSDSVGAAIDKEVQVHSGANRGCDGVQHR